MSNRAERGESGEHSDPDELDALTAEQLTEAEQASRWDAGDGAPSDPHHDGAPEGDGPSAEVDPLPYPDLPGMPGAGTGSGTPIDKPAPGGDDAGPKSGIVGGGLDDIAFTKWSFDVKAEGKGITPMTDMMWHNGGGDPYGSGEGGGEEGSGGEEEGGTDGGGGADGGSGGGSGSTSHALDPFAPLTPGLDEVPEPDPIVLDATDDAALAADEGDPFDTFD